MRTIARSGGFKSIPVYYENFNRRVNVHSIIHSPYSQQVKFSINLPFFSRYQEGNRLFY
jgi:hypothetical protein